MNVHVRFFICSSLHQSQRRRLNHLIFELLCFSLKPGDIFSFSISASNFKVLVKDSKKYKYTTSFKRKCRLVLSQVTNLIEDLCFWPSRKEGTVFVLLPENNQTPKPKSDQTKQTKYLKLCFSRQRTQGNKWHCPLRDEKRARWTLRLPPGYCFESF